MYNIFKSLSFTINTSISSQGSGSIQINHKSGHDIQWIVKLEVYDDQNRIADYINNEYLNLYTHYSELSRQVIAKIIAVQNDISDFKAFVVEGSVKFTFNKGTLQCDDWMT